VLEVVEGRGLIANVAVNLMEPCRANKLRHADKVVRRIELSVLNADEQRARCFAEPSEAIARQVRDELHNQSFEVGGVLSRP
jgi:hypothetical protein